MSAKMYSIGKAAEITGISAFTLRYYEKIGLISNIVRDQNGVRKYRDEDIRNLQFIKVMKETGMSLETLKEFLDEGCIVDDLKNGKDMSGLIQKRILLLEAQMENLREKQRELDSVLSFAHSKKNMYLDLLKI